VWSHPASAVQMPMLKSTTLIVGIALSLSRDLCAQQSQAPNQDQSAKESDIEGETMFATSCGFCHENGGRAAGKGPKLAGTTRSDEFIVERIKKGKPGAMPAFGGAFSESQIMAILAYIRSIEE
jgi:mono/diheme cytochrome c family protein